MSEEFNEETLKEDVKSAAEGTEENAPTEGGDEEYTDALGS